jgi:hypothetical protein
VRAILADAYLDRGRRVAEPDLSVTVYLGPNHDLLHCLRLYTGLIELEEKGEIQLRFRRPKASEMVLAKFDHAICARVHSRERDRSWLLGFDVSDHAFWFRQEVLKACDFYFKRSFYRPDMVKLPPDLAAKVVPFGLNFAAGRSNTARVLPRILLGRPFRYLRSPLKAIRRLRQQAAIFAVSPTPEAFEVRPSQPLDDVILLQTRVYAPADYNGDVWSLNNERVALVRSLRAHFGKRFQGGVVRSEFSLQHYGDCVTSLPSRPKEFISWSKRALIGIYTSGLYESVAFKLPEYLAGSKCILAPTLRNELPAPLVSGKHYLSFSTVEQCVSLCDDLLSSPQRARELREAAWEYYMAEVQPAAQMRRCLLRAVNSASQVSHS